MPIDDMLSSLATDFNTRWEEGTVSRWQTEKSASNGNHAEINLATVTSAQELEALGMDALKVAHFCYLRGALTLSSVRRLGVTGRADAPGSQVWRLSQRSLRATLSDKDHIA